MAYNKAVNVAYLVKSLASDGKQTKDLHPFELGFFNPSTWKSFGLSTFTQNREFVIATGSPHTGQVGSVSPGNKGGNFANANNVNRSFKTEKINGHYIDRVTIDKPVKEAKPMIGYLGYDGINECNSLKLECGKTYALKVVLKGAPVRTVYGEEKSESIMVETPCCADCNDACNQNNLCNKVMDSLLENFRTSFWLSRFLKAEKIVSCCPALTAIPTVAYSKYCVDICDEGDAIALARVQAQYDGKVKRVARDYATSTYEMECQIATAPAPADLSISGVKLTDCGVCPDGFTLVPGGPVYMVTIDNTNADLTPTTQLTEVQTKYATAVAATKLSFEYGTSTYRVVFPSNFVVPGTIPTETTISSLAIGIQEDVCTQDDPVVYEWALCGSFYKVSRTLCMLRQNPDCDDSELVEMQAFYANVENVVAGSLEVVETDDCKTLYQIEQYNNDCLEDGCDTFASAYFSDLLAFKGSTWSVCPCEGWTVNQETGCPVPPVDPDVDCSCGLKITGAFVDASTGLCSYDPADFREYDPVEFEVAFGEITTHQGSICNTELNKFQILQHPTIVSMQGHQVFNDLLISGAYRQEKYFSPSMASGHKWNDAEGLEYGINPDKFYYAIHVYCNVPFNTNFTASNSAFRYNYTFYFVEEDLAVAQAFLARLNGYCSSVGVQLPLSVL